jgi:gluconolactonase
MKMKKPIHLTLTLLLLLPTLPAHAQQDVIPNAATPAIPGIVAGGLPLELVARGFDGSEGPLGLPDGSLLFTETRANRVIQINADKSQHVYLENSNGANGLALNRANELVAVQVAQPRVGVIAPADKVRTLVDNYQAKAFVRPNDLVVDKEGGVYFTDSGANAATAAAGSAPAAELATTVGMTTKSRDPTAYS